MFVSLDIRRRKTEGKEKFREEADARYSRYAPFSPIYTYDTTTIYKALAKNDSGKVIFSLAYACACAATVHP